MDIRINPDFSELVPPLSENEYLILKKSINEENGNIIPIIVNNEGYILDGHHRFKVCQELDISPKIETKEFSDIFEEKEFIININRNRRQLNSYQIAEIGYKLEEIERERARYRQLSKLNEVKEKLPLRSNDYKYLDKGRAIDIVSKKVGLSPKTYQRAKAIIEYGPEELKEKLRQGKSTISKEYVKIQRDRKRQELLSQIDIQDNNNNDTNDNNCKLILGDFIEKGKEIGDNSIDLIITDPPYGNDSLQLYEELAKLAARVLKPGGSLVTFVGHIIMDKVISTFNEHSLKNDTGLKYWWIFAVKHSGNHRKIYPRNVFAEWKPMLWYVKGERANNLVVSNTIGDHIESKPSSKRLHEWQQSVEEAEYIIKNLTLENQTVLDPMMGSGTTGIAALRSKRKFIGIEKDENSFKIAEYRMRHRG